VQEGRKEKEAEEERRGGRGGLLIDLLIEICHKTWHVAGFNL